ncbi:MAG: hypothetical protein R3Y54_11855 [Eubacteriales bacterium]
MLRDYYQHLRIIFVAPTFCVFTNENGELVGSDITHHGEWKSPDYMVGAKNIAVKNSISFLDNFYGTPINVTNYEDYLEEDGILPNAHARSLLAERIANVLR